MVLTLLVFTSLTGCSVTQHRVGETCNSRAFVHNPLSSYIENRFEKGSPVRLGIIPFTTPANLAARSNELPGVGNDLAYKLQSAILSGNGLPISEVLNRQDWPGKKEEFFTGNHGAIQLARDAGYDLVLVGFIDRLQSLDSMTAYSKLIETESGITIWYGQTSANSTRREGVPSDLPWGPDNRKPAAINSNYLIDELARCIAFQVSRDDPREPAIPSTGASSPVDKWNIGFK
jgi:hypothetical protein